MICLSAWVYAEAEKKGLAILAFKVEGDAPADTGKVITDLITNRMKAEQYFIVERARLIDVIQEKLITDGDTLSAQDTQGLKSLGVAYVMIGHISKVEGKYYGGYRIVDVHTAKIVESDSILNAQDFTAFVDQLFISLLAKKFVESQHYEILQKSWFEDYRKGIETQIGHLEKHIVGIETQIGYLEKHIVLGNMRLFFGRTQPGVGWVERAGGIHIEVDTSAYNFPKTPAYIVSVNAHEFMHLCRLEISPVVPTQKGFLIYIAKRDESGNYCLCGRWEADKLYVTWLAIVQ